jgi:RNA polymerase sigma-70 factor, ECF subfamily
MAHPVARFQMGKKQRGDVKEAADEQLMQAVAGGDIEAFNELVHRYQGLAWKTAYRFLGDAMEAEDVAQEALLKILETASRYRPMATFRSYFYRVLTNLCIDSTRKKHPTPTSDIPEIADPSLSPTEALIEEERRARIRTALDTLPPNQRAAMILRHYEGLSYAEIARILGVSPKAVEGLISRAGTSLQSRLSDL